MQTKGEIVALSSSRHPLCWTSCSTLSPDSFFLFPWRGTGRNEKKIPSTCLCVLTFLLPPFTVGMKYLCSCLGRRLPPVGEGLVSLPSSPLSSAFPSQPHHFSLHKQFGNFSHLHKTLSWPPSSLLPFLCSIYSKNSLDHLCIYSSFFLSFSLEGTPVKLYPSTLQNCSLVEVTRRLFCCEIQCFILSLQLPGLIFPFFKKTLSSPGFKDPLSSWLSPHFTGCSFWVSSACYFSSSRPRSTGTSICTYLPWWT